MRSDIQRVLINDVDVKLRTSRHGQASHLYKTIERRIVTGKPRPEDKSLLTRHSQPAALSLSESIAGGPKP